MRQPTEANDDAQFHITQTIIALQDAGADEELIDRAEQIQADLE